jgi:hypothetical protein
VKEANLEVELDRFRLEKRLSMTRLLSEAAAADSGPLTLPGGGATPSPFFGPGGQQQGGPGSAPPSYATERERETFLEHLGQLPPDLRWVVLGWVGWVGVAWIGKENKVTCGR